MNIDAAKRERAVSSCAAAAVCCRLTLGLLSASHDRLWMHAIQRRTGNRDDLIVQQARHQGGTDSRKRSMRAKDERLERQCRMRACRADTTWLCSLSPHPLRQLLPVSMFGAAATEAIAQQSALRASSTRTTRRMERDSICGQRLSNVGGDAR